MKALDDPGDKEFELNIRVMFDKNILKEKGCRYNSNF